MQAANGEKVYTDSFRMQNRFSVFLLLLLLLFFFFACFFFFMLFSFYFCFSFVESCLSGLVLFIFSFWSVYVVP